MFNGGSIRRYTFCQRNGEEIVHEEHMGEKGRTEKSWRQQKSNPSTEIETLESLWSDSVI